MNETSEFFAGNRNVGRQYVDMTYSSWFKDIGNKIHELDYKHTTIAGWLIKQIIKALDDIEVYEPIVINIQI